MGANNDPNQQNPNQENPEKNDNPKPPDNVEVKSEKSVDPQVILTIGTKDGAPLDAVVEVDVTVINVNRKRLTGHANTTYVVRDSEVLIPVNFNDTTDEWRKASSIYGARLAYMASMFLHYEDGREEHVVHQGYIIPTNGTPITVEGIANQYENDHRPDDFAERSGPPLAVGTILRKGEKHHGPNGIFYLLLQEDGNLVINTVDGDEWRWGSHNNHGIPLDVEYGVLEEGGNLCLYHAEGYLIWDMGMQEGHSMHIHRDGDYVAPAIYNPHGEVIALL